MAIATASETYDAETPADQIPNPEFGVPASDASVERTASALREKGYAVHVVDTARAARDLIVGLLPEGGEVSQGASETLEDIGVTAEMESGRYDNIRLRTRAMDRNSPEGVRAMRKLGVGPDYYVDSAHAVTEDGTIVLASNTGSQLAPIAFGAGEVIFAIGTQKIVPDLETAFRRIEERSLPLENARMQKLYGVNSNVRKVLIIRSESRPGRITVVLIKEPVGA
ncbi:MAG TPA: lactate utilization protein [Candidatus Dormibacteraeota bacterium]|nr:lactate utilization protein [Candidatus Dormibacteraeota bacterium]